MSQSSLCPRLRFKRTAAEAGSAAGGTAITAYTPMKRLHPAVCCHCSLPTLRTRGGPHPNLPAQAGLSKERIFESSFVIATGKRIKSKGNHSKQKAIEGATVTGHLENTLRNPRTPDSRAKKANKPRPSRTPEERKEYQRQYARELTKIAKETGKCKDCSNTAIQGQIRCETCAAKRRKPHKR